MPTIELRDSPLPSRKARIRCSVTFATSALAGVLLYRGAVPSSSAQWWYIWPLTVCICGALGAYRGPSLLSDILTKSTSESCVRAFFIFAEAIVWSVLGSMTIEGFELAFTRDVLGGALKIGTVLPFGPLVGALAVLYTLWITVPLAIITGSLVFKFFRK